jgi:hypothetical protein
MTEQATGTSSADGPKNVTWPSFEQTKEAFEAYVAAVGKVAYAWNYLHEKLALLFAVISGAEREVALTSWYSIMSDRRQRKMLHDAINATDSQRWNEMPNALDDLEWLLENAQLLADHRNDAVHAPCSLYVGGNGAEMGAAFFNGHPRAKKLMHTDLLVEFAWCEGYAEALSRFTQMLETAIVFPDRIEWPRRPEILTRDHFAGATRRSQG